MKKKTFDRDFYTRAIILIILLTVTVVIVLPYVWMISNSFKSTKETLMNPNHLLPQDFTLEGYKEVLFESPFFLWLKNSVIVTVANTAIVLFTSSLIGYIFSKFEFKGKKLIFGLLLSTMMVPAQTTMIPSFILVDSLGMYDSIAALIVPAFINVFGIYLCKQYCDEVPRELIESAKIDGAGEFTIYRTIIMPCIRPALGALGIFTFLEYWNDYLNPLIYLSSTDNMTLPLALSYFNTQHTTNLSATMAASALIMIPAALVFILFQKQFIKSIAMTGIK